MRKARTVPSRIWISVPLLVLLLVAAATGIAQRKSIKQYVHQVWSTANGLPQNSASDIVQTKDGYIWFATQDGLARFDGVQFNVFDRTNTKELPDSWVFTLLEDGDGGLWIRPNGYAPGLVRYANGSFTSYRKAEGLGHDRVITWETDKHGTTWMGTLGGLSEFKGGTFKTYTKKDGLPSDTVFAVGLDSENRLWISTRGG
jgi:ligand-binding sensor domain-containing protein